MLELMVFTSPDNPMVLNYSPFCAKSLAFLRYCKLEHQVTLFAGNPASLPNGKLPVLKHDEKVIADSHFIERYLCEQFSLTVNDGFSKSELAVGFCAEKTAEEYLYWSLVYERWCVEENWLQLRDSYFAAIPKPIRPLICGMIRRGTKKMLHGHGMGRHSRQKVIDMGKEALDHLDALLVDRPYLLGERPSSYDVSIWAFTSNIRHCDLNPLQQEHIKSLQNLCEHEDRVRQLLGL